MAVVIALANQKGGVGKTTLAMHLARYLCSQDKRVVVIDADPQGNATSWLLDGDISDPGMFMTLVAGSEPWNVVRHISGLYLLPGNARTGEAYVFMSATGKPFEYARDILRSLCKGIDYVLIDMPPSSGAGYLEMLNVADYVLVPTQAERPSLEGVTFMRKSCQMVKSRAPMRGAPALLGIVPNMVRRINEHKANVAELASTMGDVVWPPIPLSKFIPEAMSQGVTVFDLLATDSEALAIAEAFRQIGERVLYATT